MEHLESNLQDKNWQQITDDMLRDLLTTYEYDVIDRSQLPSAANDANKYFTASYCGQQVFIKKIEVTPSNSKYAMRELIWLKVLKFPTIVQFLGFYYQGTDKLHLVFEHLKCDLASKLAELTPANRLCIAKQICSAVVYLHSRDVIHR
jgi:serine/threonine protein kinase